jgi:PfaB family protein
MTAAIETAKLAIVGMDSLWGTCDGLDAFERSIYDGDQHFIPCPCDRWLDPSQPALNQSTLNQPAQGLETPDSETASLPWGAWIPEFVIQPLDYKIPPEQIASFDPKELLCLKVADRALRDMGHLAQRLSLIMIGQDQFPVQQLQQTCPSCLLTLNSSETSLFNALNAAQQMLLGDQTDAVLIGSVNLIADFSRDRSPFAVNSGQVNSGHFTLSYDLKVNPQPPGEGAGAIVLKLLEPAIQAGDRIYAVIDTLIQVPPPEVGSALAPDPVAVTQACQRAFQLANIPPANIGYLEVSARGLDAVDRAEIQGLITAYQTSEPELSCAIGSAQVNIGQTGSELASLIKTALCLYHRFIPATPRWSGPKTPEIWQNNPFYVATESRPWFLSQQSLNRVAAMNWMGLEGSCTHLILSEDPNQQNRSSRYLEQKPFHLFQIAADQQSSLLAQLAALGQTLEDSDCLSSTASQTFKEFQTQAEATYCLAILGRNKDELRREIQRAEKGINDAFETGKEWQTPVGSYFTAHPLGQKTAIAFVYPGAFGSYVGLGRNIFKLFPNLHQDPVIKSVSSRLSNIEKLLYIRSLSKLSGRESEVFEQKLQDDLPVMFESEVGFASLMTAMMRDSFQIQPQAALGYSLGEISMMYAHGVWNSFSQGSNALLSSPLFEARLSGPKYAVREYWGLNPDELTDPDFWGSYILLASVPEVTAVLKSEKHLYLTQINSAKEVVIAGDSQACQRVIEKLGCDAIRAPFKHVIHCEAMGSEHPELAKLCTLPIQKLPQLNFYSAAAYKPLPLESQAIGENIAQTLCQQFDFPRLINQVYGDGHKIFIEVGAGGICSRWIGETLSSREHLVISLNKRGVEDHVSILKALAKLASHRVSMNLSRLYAQHQLDSTPAVQVIKIIPFHPRISPLPENQPDPQSLENQAHLHVHLPDRSSQALDQALDLNPSDQMVMNEKQTTPEPGALLQPSSLPLLGLPDQASRNNFSAIPKNHALMLRYRRNSLQQIGEMIKIQIELSEKFLAENSAIQSRDDLKRDELTIDSSVKT